MPDSAPSQPARAGFNSRLAIGVSADGVALVRRDGWLSHSWQLLADQPLPPVDAITKPATGHSGAQAPANESGRAGGGSNSQAEAQQSALGVAPAHEVQLLSMALESALQQGHCSKLAADIILADGWARYFMVAPPKNIGSMSDCQAAAAMRFHQLFGESGSDWQIHAEWDASAPFLACALPNNLLSGLQLACAGQKLRLHSITPHFIACWNHWSRQLQADSWFGVVNGGSLMLAAIENGRLQALRRSPFLLQHWQDKQYLPTLLQREALRLNLAMPVCLQLCGSLPQDSRAVETMGQLECKRLDAGQVALPLQGGCSDAISSQLLLALLGARK